MNTLTKLALGKMGKLRPKPALGSTGSGIALLAPETRGGMPLMEALSTRHSSREFSPRELPLSLLSTLLWAACGVNRPGGYRTAPSAMNAQEIDIFVALSSGAYRYDAAMQRLDLVAHGDLRRVTGYQDFVDDAAMDLVYVANYKHSHLIPVEKRAPYAYVAAGAVAQNVYLFAAANRLATVIRAWIDRDAIADALGLTHDQEVLLSQTVGYHK
ncbi:SagB/ThcOx family dehydrogenase [Massilia terrae]|uniref:Nitroreductase family protein n=1 Tax=Massilia terrae TaxID=1811224 RepID=A0ABT2CSF8_9BURK|nr:nitroreductase family protein [Massilia terrae]MCS0656764.1 nitroreductase family protein [Massilia terrae]